jgi:hypothetical protein
MNLYILPKLDNVKILQFRVNTLKTNTRRPVRLETVAPLHLMTAAKLSTSAAPTHIPHIVIETSDVIQCQ